MRTIYRYPIALMTNPIEEVVINMPKWSHILSFQAQEDVLCIWALIDTDNDLVQRRFYVAGTGQDLGTLPIFRVTQYIGTAQQRGFVWHLFERAAR